MGPSLTGIAAGLLILGALLWPLERAFPSVAGQPIRRRGFLTDVAYWFFSPFVTRVVARLAVVAAVVGLAVALGIPADRAHILAFVDNPDRTIRRQPLGLQILEALLLGDVVGYWIHRLFHGQRLWRFHAVHHGSKDLDWLSAVRLHPVNELVTRMAQAIPVLLVGFPPQILAGYVPFLSLYAIFLHANVPWSFGPMRYVIASPAFHRWHHTSEDEGRDKNFAGLFPFLDLLFGTFHLPQGQQPRRFGLAHEEIPEGLLGQLLYPFRRPAASSAGSS
jgi:sterol desaturase/sphingolipid hydroxylase (fatty acid hydroxylase superfamily)